MWHTPWKLGHELFKDQERALAQTWAPKPRGHPGPLLRRWVPSQGAGQFSPSHVSNTLSARPSWICRARHETPGTDPPLPQHPLGPWGSLPAHSSGMPPAGSPPSHLCPSGSHCSGPLAPSWLLPASGSLLPLPFTPLRLACHTGGPSSSLEVPSSGCSLRSGPQWRWGGRVVFSEAVQFFPVSWVCSRRAGSQLLPHPGALSTRCHSEHPLNR